MPLVVALVLAAAGLCLVTVPVAPRADAARAASPSLAVSPSTYVAGQRLTWTGSVGAPGVRTLTLQVHMGRPGDAWWDIDGFRAKTRADGSFAFSYPAPGMFDVRYRVKAGSHYSAARVFMAKTQELTAEITGQVTGQRGGDDDQAALVSADRPFGVTVDTTPDNLFRNPFSQGLPVFPGRTLTLQRRVDPDSWRTVATTTVGSDGLGRFSGLSEPAGVSVLRVRQEDYRSGGNRIGWTQTFPIYVYAGSDAWARYERQRRDAWAAVSLSPTDSADLGGAGATDNAGGRFGWYPLTWDFDWELGESLSTRPDRGTRRRGHWVEYADGAGRVSKVNGQLALDSKRFFGDGPGDFGTTRATLVGNAAVQGRWEARMRIRGAYETGGRDYQVLAELVPARAADYDCGRHNIEIARISPFSRQVRFAVRAPRYRWSGAATASKNPLHSAYAVGVEVAKSHLTWFLDGRAVASVRSRAAFPGVPMTMRLSLVGEGQEEMNHVSLVSDWQRGFPIGSGRQTVSGKTLVRHTASGCEA